MSMGSPQSEKRICSIRPGRIGRLMANCSMFDRKNIPLEVLSNCEFLSKQMFDRKNIALCLTELKLVQIFCQTRGLTEPPKNVKNANILPKTPSSNGNFEKSL